MAFDPIPLDDDDVEDMAALARLHDRLPDVLSKSVEVGPRVGTAPVARILAKRLGIDVSELHRAISNLVRLHSFRSGLDHTGEAVVDQIASSLEQAGAAAELEAWKAARSAIAKAVDVLSPEHPLVVSQAAGIVASSRSHTIRSFELFTDTRPVFSEEGDRILFTVISHTLVLEYHEHFRGSVEVQLSLDDADLDHLQFLCERAKQQAVTLKASIASPSGLPFDDVEENEGGDE
jgi:hypothetical protein